MVFQSSAQLSFTRAKTKWTANGKMYQEKRNEFNNQIDDNIFMARRIFSVFFLSLNLFEKYWSIGFFNIYFCSSCIVQNICANAMCSNAYKRFFRNAVSRQYFIFIRIVVPLPLPPPPWKLKKKKYMKWKNTQHIGMDKYRNRIRIYWKWQ